MNSILGILLFLYCLPAYATMEEVYNPVTHTYQIVNMAPPCVVPNFFTVQPQPGYTAAQTCSCQWGANSTEYYLTCKMAAGPEVVQTASLELYVLVLPVGSSTWVLAPRPNDCR